VVCTQPRRIAAQTLAQRVSQEVGTSLGDTVGYTVRFDDVTSPTTAIKYVTDGTLLREATLTDPLLSRYSVIMVDEAHERNINTDILLGVLKKIRMQRKDLRVIVCSATINALAFLDFFVPKHVKEQAEKMKQKACTKKRKRWGRLKEDRGDDEQNSNFENGTIISVDGRQYPVDILYREEPVSDYVNATVDTALRIHFYGPLADDGDILCFLPSGEDIDRAIALAEENVPKYSLNFEKKKRRPLQFFPLYGSLPYHLQAIIFKPKSASDSNRRLIFSSNMSETSVTVPHISSVIDCGFAKIPHYDTKTGFDRLIISPISKASAQQRAGRAGRMKPGKCYRLYSEAAMSKHMEDSVPPEIMRTNLSSFLLTLKALGIHNILSFDLMSMPTAIALCHGLESLYALGAIDDETNLTGMGNKMAEFPTEPRVSRMLLESLSQGCTEEVLCVASALQVRSLFHQPRNQNQEADYDNVMSDLIDRSGDHLTFINLMQMEDATPLSQSDCKERFVNYLALKRSIEVRKQLSKFLKVSDMDSNVTDDDKSRAIRRSITAGFFQNAAKVGNDGRYYSLRGRHTISISTGSVLHRVDETSEYIIFGQTYDGSRGGIEVRFCSAIEGKWLLEIAPYYWA